MSNARKIAQINIIINKSLYNELQDFLFSLGIKYFYSTVSRSLMLEENEGLSRVFSGDNTTVDEQSVTISLLVDKKYEEQIIAAIIEKMKFDIAGRGTIFSKEVSLLNSNKNIIENQNLSVKAETKKLPVELAGIIAILMRGEGDQVARVSLDTGSSVPNITYGKGAGLRDKIGLWRITIPAEKDVVTALTAAHDVDAVMNLMIDKGQLDQPGKGFIYTYPINKGILNTKIHIGMPKHAASIEQIINVIDEIKNSSSWRKREGYADENKSKRKYLTNLIEMALICVEGFGPDLTKIAMNVGAPGATISKLKLVTNNETLSKQPPARELCSLIIGEALVKPILEALEKNNAFDNEKIGQVLINPVVKAFTYFGKKK